MVYITIYVFIFPICLCQRSRSLFSYMNRQYMDWPGTCIILDTKYNIANSSCHFGSYDPQCHELFLYINHVLQLSSFLVQNIKLYYNFGIMTILRHLNRFSKVKTNFASYPKLGHGREHNLGLRFVLRWSQDMSLS